MTNPSAPLDRRRWTFVAAAAVLAIATLLGLPGPRASADPTEGVTGVTGVIARDDSVTVSGTATAGAEVSVYALGTEEPIDAWSTHDPVATLAAGTDGAFSAEIARTPERTDLYYAKYVAVVGGAVVGTYRYVDDNQVTPLASFPYPEALNKKGVTTAVTDDAEELGVQHATVNMPLNQLMLLENKDPENTITFVSNGREFYFNKGTVEARDRLIKPMSDNGSVVNLVLLVQPTSDPNSAGSVLAHPDADPTGGRVLGFNTATAEGVAYYTAAIEFFAQRYSRADQAYGRATGFIVGNEINAAWPWQNMGDITLDDFLLYYERALRLTEMATKSAYGEARTYTSLTHCWRTLCGTNPDPENPTRFYPAPDVLEGINQLTKDHGDYGWHVAHHPYPEDLFDPAFWNDTEATDDVETSPMITFKNIELLPEFLARPEMTYQGTPRRIILSEQGCHTPDTTEAGERLQAACYALAYYKIRFLDTIDSFILHRHIDHKNEGGLRLGLWTWDDERTEPNLPGEPKRVHEVFQYIDTERSLEVTEFAKEVIGIDDWSEMVPGWDPDALAERPLPAVGGVSTTARTVSPRPISTFDSGTDGWQVSDNATSVTAEGGDLVVGFDYLAKMWRGADVELPEPVDASATPYLGVTLEVPDAPGIGTRYARVKAYTADGGVIAGGTARLAAGGGAQHLSLDLSGWAPRSEVTRLKVWVRGETSADWEGTFRIAEVVRAPQLADTGRTTNLDITASTGETADVGVPLDVTVTNWDLRPLDAAVRVVPCDGVVVEPESFDVDELATGATQTFTGTISAYDPADAGRPEVCVAVQDATFRVPVDMPPPTPVSLFDFDDGTVQGWQAGSNVASVAAVTTFANGPRRPHAGTYALDATGARVAAALPRSVVVQPDQPLDLSDAYEVSVFLNSYGGAPGATGYEATFTLRSGSDQVTLTQPYSPNRWNELVLDVSDWTGRSSVDRIEVGMRAVGATASEWTGHLQVDSMAYYDRPRD